MRVPLLIILAGLLVVLFFLKRRARDLERSRRRRIVDRMRERQADPELKNDDKV